MTPTTLDALPNGQTATVRALDARGEAGLALREAGVVVGAEIEVLARGLFGGTPLSVRVGRGVLALRRAEARRVTVA